MLLLNVFGELERFSTEQLYPNRYLIAPLLVVAVLGAMYVFYRLGLHIWVRRHPVVATALGAPLLVVVLVAGNYLLSPLWERSHLEEESPLAALPAEAANDVDIITGPNSSPASTPETAEAPVSPATSSATPVPPSPTPQPTPAFQPSVALEGSFSGADDFHFGRGQALLIETEPGKYVLRFQDFSVRNGPDLFVYLSEDPTGEHIDEAFNLGSLKATDGAFNYEVPPHIDVSRIRSAVVWCRQFSVLFAHAELM